MKLFYRQYGEGQPIIILHGIFGISDNWVSIGKRLAEKFAVYIPDQRNHGQSPHSRTFNYFALSEDLFEFIEDNQLVNPVLIGHSMGGKTAMNFALEHPHKVDKLIVVDMSTRSYPARQEQMIILNAMRSVNFDNVKSRGEVEEIISKSIRSSRVQQFILKNIYRIGKTRLAWRLNVEVIFENIENVLEGIESPYSFDKQSLFIRGGLSDYLQEKDYELIRRNFPAAKFATIKNATHWVHADAPDELCEVFNAFL